jgi:hypothetical protein
LCVTVTGKTDASAVEASSVAPVEAEELQPASPATTAADRDPVRSRRRLRTTGLGMRAA